MSGFMNTLINFFRDPAILLRDFTRDVLTSGPSVTSASGSGIADAIVSHAEGNFSASGTGLGLGFTQGEPAPEEPAETDLDMYFYVFVVLSIVFVKFWIKLLPKGLIKIWLTYFLKYANPDEGDVPDYDLATRPPRTTTRTSSTTSRFSQLIFNETGLANLTGFGFDEPSTTTVGLLNLITNEGLLNLTTPKMNENSTMGLAFTLAPLVNQTWEDVPVLFPPPLPEEDSKGPKPEPIFLEPREAEATKFMVRIEPKGVDYILCMGSLVHPK